MLFFTKELLIFNRKEHKVLREERKALCSLRF